MRPTLFLLFLLIVFSCKKPQEPEVYMGYDYFPLNEGHWVQYDIDSIDYNAFTGSVDTFSYQLKEVIGAGFEDNAGRSSQRIERFFRKTGMDPWKLQEVWFATLVKERAEKVENNQKFVKLIFPIREGSTWKGNAFNSLDPWDFVYEDVYKPGNFQNLQFDSTLAVKQIDEHNLIERKYYKEIYARNVGLVNKEITDIQTEVDGTIKSGLKFSQRIKAFGK